MRPKRRELLAIIACTATPLSVARKTVWHADADTKGILAYAAGAIVFFTLVVFGLIYSAEVHALTRAFATNWFVGTVAAREPDPAPSIADLYREAQAENLEAEFQLGVRYAKGQGVALDYVAAARWFGAAADRGVARAQFDMGVLYEHGRGVPINNAKAAEWYLKAAEGGCPLAQYNLAVFYTQGRGVSRDITRAVFWYRRAATQGVVQAMVNLAILYDKGYGIRRDPVYAYAWYLSAAASGSQAARQRAVEMAALLPLPDQARAKLITSDIAAEIEPHPEIASFAANAEQSGQ